MVDATDLKSVDFRVVPVRVRPTALFQSPSKKNPQRAGRIRKACLGLSELMETESSAATANRRFKIEPVLGGLALLLLLVGCFFILKPFMTALLWAIILAYSLYPLQRVFTRWFRGSRTLAACFVTLTVTLALAGPIVLVGFSIAQDGKDLANATRNWFMAAPDQAPPWVGKIPIVGKDAAEYWEKIAGNRKEVFRELEKKVITTPPRPKIVIESENGTIIQDPPPAPEIKIEPSADEKIDAPTEGTGEDAIKTQNFVAILGKILTVAWGWLLSITLAVGQGLTQLVLSGFLAFFLLRDAPVLSSRLGVAADRLAGSRGLYLLKVAGDTVKGVIYGIIGTAVVQSLFAGLGFWIAGIPGGVLLAVLTFFFAVVPFGPPVIWIPAALWLFAQGQVGMGVFLTLWGLFVISGVDNVLRPFLISQNSKLPFVLIFCGVIGGALAFGLVGLFLGPTLLAVVYRLIDEWSANPERQKEIAAEESSSGLIEKLTSNTQLHGDKSVGVG